MLNQQWKLDDARHRQVKYEEWERQQELNRVLKESNEQQQAYRAKQAKIVKEADMKMIRAVVEREKM